MGDGDEIFRVRHDDYLHTDLNNMMDMNNMIYRVEIYLFGLLYSTRLFCAFPNHDTICYQVTNTLAQTNLSNRILFDCVLAYILHAKCYDLTTLTQKLNSKTIYSYLPKI